MNRRQLLKYTAALCGGVISSSLSSAVLNGVSANQKLSKKSIFTQQQQKLIANISEQIIPTTETPGAITAGVPKFIETIVSEWYRADERKQFFSALSWFEDLCKQKYSTGFLQLTNKQQIKILQLAENISLNQKQDKQPSNSKLFFNEMKQLTILGYYTSEAGVTQELRYNPMPMRFQGDYPLKPSDTNWSS